MKNALRISTGGEKRLRNAIEGQVRREHEAEIAAAIDHWQKRAIEDKIAQEIEDRMKSLASPQSLWAAH
jgi:hypothetical protein